MRSNHIKPLNDKNELRKIIHRLKNLQLDVRTENNNINFDSFAIHQKMLNTIISDIQGLLSNWGISEKLQERCRYNNSTF